MKGMDRRAVAAKEGEFAVGADEPVYPPLVRRERVLSARGKDGGIANVDTPSFPRSRSGTASGSERARATWPTEGLSLSEATSPISIRPIPVIRPAVSSRASTRMLLGLGGAVMGEQAPIGLPKGAAVPDLGKVSQEAFPVFIAHALPQGGVLRQPAYGLAELCHIPLARKDSPALILNGLRELVDPRSDDGKAHRHGLEQGPAEPFPL